MRAFIEFVSTHGQVLRLYRPETDALKVKIAEGFDRHSILENPTKKKRGAKKIHSFIAEELLWSLERCKGSRRDLNRLHHFLGRELSEWRKINATHLKVPTIANIDPEDPTRWAIQLRDTCQKSLMSDIDGLVVRSLTEDFRQRRTQFLRKIRMRPVSMARANPLFKAKKIK